MANRHRTTFIDINDMFEEEESFARRLFGQAEEIIQTAYDVAEEATQALNFVTSGQAKRILSEKGSW